jgi:metal-responsive CopG/Arc/MetJ family transcriptional regulator
MPNYSIYVPDDLDAHVRDVLDDTDAENRSQAIQQIIQEHRIHVDG